MGNKKIMKRILAVLLSVIISICSVPVTAHAALRAGDSIRFKYYIGTEGYFVTSNFTFMGDS